MKNPVLGAFMDGLFALAKKIEEPPKLSELFDAFVSDGIQHLPNNESERELAAHDMAQSFLTRAGNHFGETDIFEVLLNSRQGYGDPQTNEREHYKALSENILARSVLEIALKWFRPKSTLSDLDLKRMKSLVGLHDVAMGVHKVNPVRYNRFALKARLLALNCGFHATKELSTPENERGFLPPASGGFTEWYSCGILLRDGVASKMLTKHRSSKDTGPAKELADEILLLMEVAPDNGKINDLIAAKLGKLGNMPGGIDEIRRINRDAPSYRKGD